MKITKAKLNKCLREPLEKKGYLFFSDGILGSQGLYVKKIDDYFVTLGLLISGFYDYKFSADIYISTNPNWNFLGKGIPKLCSFRLKQLLNQDELEEFAFELEKGIYDDWWHELSGNSIDCFLNAVEIAEDRIFLEKELLSQILKSETIQKYNEDISSVIESINTNVPFEFSEQRINEIPQKSVGNIPMIWFKASYLRIIETRPKTLGKLDVKTLAINSWIVSFFENNKAI